MIKVHEDTIGPIVAGDTFQCKLDAIYGKFQFTTVISDDMINWGKKEVCFFHTTFNNHSYKYKNDKFHIMQIMSQSTDVKVLKCSLGMATIF